MVKLVNALQHVLQRLEKDNEQCYQGLGQLRVPNDYIHNAKQGLLVFILAKNLEIICVETKHRRRRLCVVIQIRCKRIGFPDKNQS